MRTCTLKNKIYSFLLLLQKIRRLAMLGAAFLPDRNWPELPARSQLGPAPQSPSLSPVFPKPRLSILCEGPPVSAVFSVLLVFSLHGLGTPVSSLPHCLWKCPSQLLTPVAFGVWGAGSPSRIEWKSLSLVKVSLRYQKSWKEPHFSFPPPPQAPPPIFDLVTL